MGRHGAWNQRFYTIVIRTIITHATIVWWPKVEYKTIKAKLSKLQRQAYLGIIRAIKWLLQLQLRSSWGSVLFIWRWRLRPRQESKFAYFLPTTFTTNVKVVGKKISAILIPHSWWNTNLGVYRLSCSKQWKPTTTECKHVRKVQDMMKDASYRLGWQNDTKTCIQQTIHWFAVRFLDRCDWEKNSVHIKEGGLIWSSGVPVDPRKWRQWSWGVWPWHKASI